MTRQRTGGTSAATAAIGWTESSGFMVREIGEDGTLAPLDLTTAALSLDARYFDASAAAEGAVGISSLLAGRRFEGQKSGNLSAGLREAAFERAGQFSCHKNAGGELMLLYTYFRSSASWRVRIALALKGVTPRHEVIRTVDGEQNTAGFRQKNPLGVIPVLDIGEGRWLNQSLAIIEWLEEVHPAPPLLPVDPPERARVRAFALAVACEIHPLNNLRVLNFLEQMLGQDEQRQRLWYHHWIKLGLEALESTIQSDKRSPFCFGDVPSLADVFLVPQIANARRWKCPLEAYPTLLRAEAAALELPAFRETAPEKQPDAIT